MTYVHPDFFSNIWFSDESHIHLDGYINRKAIRFLGFGQLDVVVQKPLIMRGLRFCAPYTDKGSKSKPRTLQRDYYRPICAGFQMFLPRQKPATVSIVDAEKWRYSPHGGGITCLSLTTLWLSLNFPWNVLRMPTYGAC